MPSLVVNIKTMKKCAFCKHWCDPACTAISPKSPAIGLWEIKDINQKCLCTKRNILTAANAFCSQNFEKKL